MADDLDDEWWQQGSGTVVSEEEDGEESDSHDSGPRTKKQKVDNISIENDDSVKQKKKNKKKKKKKNLSQKLEETGAYNKEPKAEHFIQAYDGFYADKLSDIEKDEYKITEEYFGACNDLTHTPNSFLRMLLPKWKKLVEGLGDKKGAPLLLIFSMSAMRCITLEKEIKDFKGKDCKMAKLFAKNKKIKEQVYFLSHHKSPLGVGTPNRIIALIESGDLHLDQLSHIMIDWSWRDAKQFTLLEHPDIKEDMFKLIQKHLIPRLKSGQCKLALF